MIKGSYLKEGEGGKGHGRSERDEMGKEGEGRTSGEGGDLAQSKVSGG